MRGRAPTRLVVTEHVDFLSPERRARYERVRERLEEAGGVPVEVVHYADVSRLGNAETLVLSGSSAPWATHDREELARLGESVARAGRPVLGICAGMQLLTMWAGGDVRPMRERGAEPERGYLPLEVMDGSDLFAGLGRESVVFQDHEDEVTALPDGFRGLARTERCEVQAFSAPERRWWGTQFHPEVWDGEHADGARVLANFFALAAE